MLNTSKLRNVYRRHDVLHTCFNGFLVGPEGDSAIEAGTKVRVTPVVKADGLVFEVFVPGRGRRAAIKETWFATKVPGDDRKPTKERVERIPDPE